MGTRTYYVMKEHKSHWPYESEEHDVPYEKEAAALMTSDSYLAYVEKYGYHFTDALADKATSIMVNTDSSKHNWTTQQVRAAITGMGIKLPDNITWGDMAYLANMYYADLFPEVLETEAKCLKAAIAVANDPDGYKGMTFCRWTTDIIGKNTCIDWENYVCEK